MTEWTTSALTDDLIGRLLADRWLAVREVQLEQGQRADVLAMRRKFDVGPMMVVEIKTTRGDLLRDLKADKWRGYLASAAVAFAFPKGLADKKEIPAEAGVVIRIAQGWSWQRPPRWSKAPAPTDWLHRRLAMTVSDQVAARVDAMLRPRAVNLWKQASDDRDEVGRRLARIATDVEVWTKLAADKQAEYLAAVKRLEEVNEQLCRAREEAAA